jgi:hypothetical protein
MSNQTTHTSALLAIDQVDFIQMADTAILIAAARGEIDLSHLARETLSQRGLNLAGGWVGFNQANKLLITNS